MNYEKISQMYFSALELGDVEAIVALFAPEGRVISPLYGTMSCQAFYEQLANDTTDSRIELKRVLTSEGAAAAHFVYHWTLSNGKTVQFEGVDLFEINEQDLITQLTIIYDTQYTRQEWEQR